MAGKTTATTAVFGAGPPWSASIMPRLSNAAKRREAATQLRLIQLAERRLSRELRTEFVRVAEEAAAAYPRWQGVLAGHRARLSRILTRHLTATAQAAAERAWGTMKSANPTLIETKLDTMTELLARIAKWSTRHAASEVQRVSDTTKERINHAVTLGIANLESSRTIARRISSTVGGMSASRASTIARTESHVAHNTGQQMSMEDASEEFEVEMLKEWLSSSDARTRDDHRDANGQRVALDESFIVGGARLKYPGDPNGPPEQIINCRCAVVYVPA